MLKIPIRYILNPLVWPKEVFGELQSLKSEVRELRNQIELARKENLSMLQEAKLLCEKSNAGVNELLNSREGTGWMIVDNVSLRVQRSLDVVFLHQKSFLPFKGCNKGRDAYLVCTGPSLNKFSVPSKSDETIFIGVNKAYLKSNIIFDYLFAIDKVSIMEDYRSFFAYGCTKFVGDQNLGVDYQIPESFLCRKDVKRYKTTAAFLPEQMPVDLDSYPLVNSNSVAIQAMQFALYTTPKRIYLVGNDCTVSQNSHFYEKRESADILLRKRGENLDLMEENLKNSWGMVKKFRDTYYPDTEIISVNPVNLRGLFQDIFTD